MLVYACVCLRVLLCTHTHTHNHNQHIHPQVFFRAVYACPHAKALWLDAFTPPLRAAFSREEERDCLKLLVGKGVLVRVDPPI